MFLKLTLVQQLFFNKVAKSILQLVTSNFLLRATNSTSSERISQRVTSDFLQRATSGTINKQILQQVVSDFL